MNLQKLFSKLKVQLFDHDPGATTAIVTSPDGGTTIRTVDMRGCRNFGVLAMSSTLTGNGITKLEIIAAALATMASPEVIKDSGTVAADAVGDYVGLECSAEEVAQKASDTGKALRYVAARITCHNAADEAVVLYLQDGIKFKGNALTANSIA